MTSNSSARGNTTLESAVTLTKALRWDIQSLGVRLQRAATAEESSRRNKTKAKSRATHELEIRRIVQDIKNLLIRIEDAVPLINLAITTSGASLSTTLPASVSPSRLLQASTFLTAGDTQYSINPGAAVQVGPSFTLSLYMLFAGHVYRANSDTESMRDTTWKEIIHKARVKLVRIPLTWDSVGSLNGSGALGGGLSNRPVISSIEDVPNDPLMSGEGSASEFAYQLEIIEDLDDDRVHSFEDDEAQPGPYGDVRLAGIREFLPIHQISKIFYADTGKILNIGNQGETNSPVLLLKRDINALPPRRMMQHRENNEEWQAGLEEEDGDELEDESQDDIDQQIRREGSVHLTEEKADNPKLETPGTWQLPPDLDPEWLAVEVYTESEEESNSEDEQDINDDSAYASHRPSSSGEEQVEANLASGLADLNLDPRSSPPPSNPPQQVTGTTSSQTAAFSPKASPFGPIRSSLSLLEMLIRLTALQQFQQASHLSIPDELLTFFLEESSTTGAGGDGDERRRTRREARQKVGFDPYDESPVKRHGEEYQYQNQGQGYERDGTHYEYEQSGYGYDGAGSPRWMQERSMTPQGSPEPWLLRSREAFSPRRGSTGPSSPIQPYRQPTRRPTRPLDRVMQERGVVKNGSPLGRGMSVETDSTLGTSPSSPTHVSMMEKVDLYRRE